VTNNLKVFKGFVPKLEYPKSIAQFTLNLPNSCVFWQVWVSFGLVDFGG